MKKATKGPSIKTAQALLAKHECPVPFHEVRTRFLGNIATPAISASPLQIIKDLWGGELPPFDSIEEVNELLDSGFTCTGAVECAAKVRLASQNGADVIKITATGGVLSQQARDILTRLSDILERFPNPIRVEGHTDNVPISTPAYPSNWELSAARAIAATRAPSVWRNRSSAVSRFALRW
mgnify:CR=1 FL=1